MEWRPWAVPLQLRIEAAGDTERKWFGLAWPSRTTGGGFRSIGSAVFG